jgi:hypothetical protein
MYRLSYICLKRNFGAIPWSGVQRVIAGARDSDARSIGFDEGPEMKNLPASGAYFGGEVLRLTCGMRKGSLQLFQLICKIAGIFSSFVKIKPILRKPGNIIFICP